MLTQDTPASLGRRLPATSALLLLALISSGCSTPAPDTGATTTDNARAVEFAACMRTNGVSDFPDPDASGKFDYGITVSGEQWVAALEACRDLQPEGSFSADRSPEQQSAALLFAQCIRDNGVSDFPDPVNGEPLIDTNKIPSTNTEEGMAILDAALNACSELGTAAREGRE